MCDKKSLRSLCRKRRESVTDKLKKAADAADILLECREIKNAENILLYAAVGSETDTFELMERLLNLQKKIALPKCHENGIMTFHYINSADELITGKYNIPEPPESAPSLIMTDKAVCIVPGLAFTESGARLGYGGGYYDRFIALYPQLYKIGLTYEAMIFPELPTLPHDLKMDAIVTEERMVLCCAK